MISTIYRKIDWWAVLMFAGYMAAAAVAICILVYLKEILFTLFIVVVWAARNQTVQLMLSFVAAAYGAHMIISEAVASGIVKARRRK